MLVTQCLQRLLPLGELRQVDELVKRGGEIGLGHGESAKNARHSGRMVRVLDRKSGVEWGWALPSRMLGWWYVLAGREPAAA
ncbi:hypothetical protein GCM10027276_20460 [Comamonas piscis]